MYIYIYMYININIYIYIYIYLFIYLFIFFIVIIISILYRVRPKGVSRSVPPSLKEDIAFCDSGRLSHQKLQGASALAAVIWQRMLKQAKSRNPTRTPAPSASAWLPVGVLRN